LNFKLILIFHFFCFLFQAEDNDEVSGFTDDVLHRSDSVADSSGRIAIENAQNPVRHSAGDRVIIHESDRQHWRRRSRQHKQQHQRQ
jgi:hypothetical protein